MVIARPINLNVSCKLHPYALQSVVTGSIFSGGDHGIHCWCDLIRSKLLSSVFVCRALVFAGFSVWSIFLKIYFVHIKDNLTVKLNCLQVIKVEIYAFSCSKSVQSVDNFAIYRQKSTLIFTSHLSWEHFSMAFKSWLNHSSCSSLTLPRFSWKLPRCLHWKCNLMVILQSNVL